MHSTVSLRLVQLFVFVSVFVKIYSCTCILSQVTVCNMSFIGYPETPRVAPLPWLGVHVPLFPTCWFFRGFRVRLRCIQSPLIVKDFCKNIDLALNKRWLGWPTRTDINSLCARLSSGGKIFIRCLNKKAQQTITSLLNARYFRCPI